MVTLYNTSNLTGNYIEMTTGLNQLSAGLLISMILFVLYIVLFVAVKNQGTRTALLGVSFIITFLASVAWYLEWISGYIVMIPVVALIFSIFMIGMEGD